MMSGFVAIALLVGCFTPFNPKYSEGTWLESDYRVEFNSACPVNGIFNDALRLEYSFGDESGFEDTGAFYGSSIVALETYRDNIWGLCTSYGSNAAFTCDHSLILTQYDAWRENFPVEQVREDTGCVVKAGYGLTEGLFVTDSTVRTVQSIYVTCVGSEGTSLRVCDGTLTSLWTKQ